MNCRKENYETFIIFKANGWHEIATRAIDKHQRAWGAKNYRRLIRRHPEIFGDPESKGEGRKHPSGPTRPMPEIHVHRFLRRPPYHRVTVNVDEPKAKNIYGFRKELPTAGRQRNVDRLGLQGSRPNDESRCNWEGSRKKQGTVD